LLGNTIAETRIPLTASMTACCVTNRASLTHIQVVSSRNFKQLVRVRKTSVNCHPAVKIKGCQNGFPK
jgi:autonomous glycyl radical cofactor GrcA